MQLATFLAQYTGRSVDALFNGPDGPLVRPHVDVAGEWSFPGWDEGAFGKAPPASEDVAVALASGPAASELIAYANAKQWSLATGGYAATIGGRAIRFATDEASLSGLDRKAMRLAQPNPPASVNWQTGPDTFVAIGADDFAHAATKVDDFVQATFDALPPIFAGIASGSIATFADVDRAAWPEAAGAVS